MDEITQLHDEMVGWRQDLHAHPELGFAEARTSTFIQERLQSFGVDEVHSFTGTGVIAVIRGKREGDNAIGLRADIDALSHSRRNRRVLCLHQPGNHARMRP